jgi:hypothetical protein
MASPSLHPNLSCLGVLLRTIWTAVASDGAPHGSGHEAARPAHPGFCTRHLMNHQSKSFKMMTSPTPENGAISEVCMDVASSSFGALIGHNSP